MAKLGTMMPKRMGFCANLPSQRRSPESRLRQCQQLISNIKLPESRAVTSSWDSDHGPRVACPLAERRQDTPESRASILPTSKRVSTTGADFQRAFQGMGIVNCRELARHPPNAAPPHQPTTRASGPSGTPSPPPKKVPDTFSAFRLWKGLGSPMPDSEAVWQTFSRILRPGTLVLILSTRENAPLP
jgi:hypothetical protein